MNKYNYEIVFSKRFLKDYKKAIKNNNEMEKRIKKVIEIMRLDPFYKGLKIHFGTTRLFGTKYSTKVTPDIRVICEFRDNKAVIYTLALGGHSGKRKVYR